MQQMDLQKIKFFRVVLLTLLNFLKSVNSEDTRIIEHVIKATFSPDVTFFRSSIAYNIPEKVLDLTDTA